MIPTKLKAIHFGVRSRQPPSGSDDHLAGASDRSRKKYGHCTRRELLDVLYNLRPEDIEYQQMISGNRGQLHPIRFERNSVHWEKFFESEFSIRVLPQGRELALHPDQQSDESPSTKSGYAIGLKVRHTAA